MTPREPQVIDLTAEPPRLLAIQVAPLMVAAIAGGIRWGCGRPRRPKNDERPCIVCQKPHTGNNAFCSADCCRKHKSR